METFVEKPRFAGTVYKAANWTHIGTTRGRGHYDRYNECALAKKDIWVQPLRRDWKRRLND